MERYHFNLHERSGFVQDEEGRELPGMAEVRSEALKGVRSLVAEDAIRGRIDLSGRIEVLDSKGLVVFALSFGDAVELLR